MSDSFTIRIDRAALDGVLVTLQLLKSYLPTNACTSLTKGVAKTKETFADETVKTLNVDFEQVDSEIETTVPDTETLDGYRAEITSKGIPIELYDFAPGAAGWKRKKPVHVQIFRGGATHEFRHVTVGQQPGLWMDEICARGKGKTENIIICPHSGYPGATLFYRPDNGRRRGHCN